jgi:hypothetical protein
MKVKAEKRGEPSPPAPVPIGAEALLSKDRIAELLGVTTRMVEMMVSAGEYPAPDLRVGRLPRWRTLTHNGWVQQRTGGN